jgi:hypothetical protein
LPIVFAPADPVSPSLSAAAGYADEFAKLFPSMASLAAHQFSAQQASVNSGPQSYQQAQQFQQQMQQQAGMQTQALSAQSNMQNAAQTAQSQMMNQQTQNNIYEQQQAAQQEIAQQWTSQDESQLSQVQNGWSQVQADPSLSPEEKQQAQQQYLPYIQQQQQKKQYWLTKMKGQQQQELAEQTAHIHAQNTAMEMQATAAKTGNMQKLMSVQPIKNADGDEVGHLAGAPTGDGKYSWFKFDKVPKNTEASDAADAFKAKEAEIKHQRDDHKFWSDEHDKAMNIVTGWTKEKEGVGENQKSKYPQYDDPAKFSQAVTDIMDAKGLGRDPDAFVRRKSAERNPQAAPPAKVDQSDQAKPGAGVMRTAGGGEIPAPPTPSRPAPAPTGDESKPQPFKMTEPKTDDQRKAKDQYTGMFQQLQSLLPGLSDDKAAEGLDNLREFSKIWQQYGSPKAMDADVKKRLDFHLDNINRVIQEGKRSSPPPSTGPIPQAVPNALNRLGGAIGGIHQSLFGQ